MLTDIEGSRGVDYKFKDTTSAHVIIAFNPKKSHYSTLMQALSRGSRDCEKGCNGTLVCDKELWDINQEPSIELHSNIEAMRIEFEQGSINIQNKIKFCQIHHDVKLTNLSPTEDES